MNRRRHYGVLLAALWTVLLSNAVDARAPDGTLSLVFTPNSLQPAIVKAGGVFETIVSGAADLTLESSEGASLALETTRGEAASGWTRVRCQLPADAPPGMYEIKAVAGDSEDANPRSVLIVAEPPVKYAVAHFAAPRMGAEGAETRIRAAIETVNASPAHLLLISGSLTANGLPEEYQALITLMDACRIPSFAVAGPQDGLPPLPERYLGPSPYIFWCGEDGFLGFHAPDPYGGLGRQTSDLRVLRRTIKPARWSIGFAASFGTSSDVRDQITLLVDDPLDLILTSPLASGKPERLPAPWGPTALAAGSGDGQDPVLFFQVTPSGFMPGLPPPEPAVEGEGEGEGEQAAEIPETEKIQKN